MGRNDGGDDQWKSNDLSVVKEVGRGETIVERIQDELLVKGKLDFK